VYTHRREHFGMLLGQRDRAAAARQIRSWDDDPPHPGLARPRNHGLAVAIEVREVQVAVGVNQQDSNFKAQDSNVNTS
jgi:hypothetical protein